MAALHAQAFDGSARWSAESFTAMLDRSDTIIVSGNDGFALGRVMADEAELLTIVVSLAQRGQGTARTLLSGFDRPDGRRWVCGPVTITAQTPVCCARPFDHRS